MNLDSALLNNKLYVIGCDEVGYGSVAGSVVVCGVRAPKNWSLSGLNDSKKLSPKKREVMRDKLFKLISNNEISYHLAERSNQHIDKFGIAFSLKDSYVEIFHKLYEPQSLIISDGILKFDNLGVDAYDKISLIKADSKIPAVMAASIIAKTYRDEIMKNFHNQYPEYNWKDNVGYPASKHIEAIRKYGYTSLHRRSYKIKNLSQQVNIKNYKGIYCNEFK